MITLVSVSPVSQRERPPTTVRPEPPCTHCGQPPGRGRARGLCGKCYARWKQVPGEVRAGPCCVNRRVAQITAKLDSTWRSTAEVAALTGFTQRTIARYCRAGRIPETAAEVLLIRDEGPHGAFVPCWVLRRCP